MLILASDMQFEVPGTKIHVRSYTKRPDHHISQYTLLETELFIFLLTFLSPFFNVNQDDTESLLHCRHISWSGKLQRRIGGEQFLKAKIEKEDPALMVAEPPLKQWSFSKVSWSDVTLLLFAWFDVKIRLSRCI